MNTNLTNRFHYTNYFFALSGTNNTEAIPEEEEMEIHL